MFASRLFRIVLMAVVVGLCTVPADAQWARQVIPLRPGWNAVFFEVQPAPNSCEAVFKTAPVKSVWAWNERFSSAQYVRDPSTLVPEQPEWLVYFPSYSGKAFLTDLFAVHGGRAYLIELDGETPIDLELSGDVVLRETVWLANSFNLVGFNVDPSAPPTFKRFFAPTEAIDTDAVYRLSASGHWERVTEPASETLNHGEAYWVYCEGPSTYSGPLSVGLESPGGLAYGRLLTEQMLRLRNDSSAPKRVTLRLMPSMRPSSRPADNVAEPLAAGGVALAYNRVFAWEPLREPLTVTLEPESERGVRLAVLRGDMAPSGSPNALYTSILEVMDGDGSLYRVPVSATKNSTGAGLWVGTVVLNAVSEAANPEDSTTPTPTASEMRFRIIVHVSDEGQAHLLQSVILMQVQPTYVPESPGSGVLVVDTPGRYVLLTRDDLIPQYEGVAMRDGEIVGRRISSPTFGFSTPVPLTGTSSTLFEATVVMAHDDPLNPFLHRYHPDHDNLNERYDDTLAEGKESFTFSRAVTLRFTADDPEGLDVPGWGSDILGGTYEEKITGVHQNEIYVQGRFRLNRVSDVGTLNDGQ